MLDQHLLVWVLSGQHTIAAVSLRMRVPLLWQLGGRCRTLHFEYLRQRRYQAAAALCRVTFKCGSLEGITIPSALSVYVGAVVEQ